MEKKALQVHGSLETIGKLEANRVLQEDKLKQLKYIYAQVRKRLPQSPDVLSEGESTGADGVKGTQVNTLLLFKAVAFCLKMGLAFRAPT